MAEKESYEYVIVGSGMGVGPSAERLLSEGSLALKAAAAELGYVLGPMPKFISSRKCRKCAECSLGCSQGANWTALLPLNSFVLAGGRFFSRCSVCHRPTPGN